MSTSDTLTTTPLPFRYLVKMGVDLDIQNDHKQVHGWNTVLIRFPAGKAVILEMVPFGKRKRPYWQA